MPVEFPDGRKMHVARICGTNKADEVLPEIWVDVIRIDRIKINTHEEQRLKHQRTENQEITIKLKWKDEEGRDGYTEESNDDPSSARKVVIVKVCSPDEEDPADPKEWVPIPAIKRVFLLQSYKAVSRHFFDSVLADKNRTEVEIRKFSHYDTNIDDQAEEAFDNGDTVYVVPVDEYEFEDDTKAEETYLEHEVVLKSNIRMTPHWEESPGGSDQKYTFTFKNQFLIDGSDKAEKGVPGGDINPPWRVDPFQNIVNCQFAPTVIVAIIDNLGGGSASSLHKRAKYLGTRSVVGGGNVYLFKVNAGLGKEFASTTCSSLNTLVGMNWIVLLWAGEEDENIAKAMQAAEQILTANINDPDTPLAQLTPDNVLWHGYFYQVVGGSTQTWKVDYVKHRSDTNTVPPNMMVQCFPLSSIPSTKTVPSEPSSIFFTNLGYNISFYRLDRKGEKNAYDPPPEWANDVISTARPAPGGNYGCKFQDELPLASVDRPFTNILGSVGINEPPG